MAEARKVRITSDGTPAGSAVVDMATGEPLDGVVAVRWEVEWNNFARATVEFAQVAIDAVGETPPLQDPDGGRRGD